LQRATDVDVYLAWREPPTHPAVADLLDLIREIASFG
jgi:hypothetical protein